MIKLNSKIKELEEEKEELIYTSTIVKKKIKYFKTTDGSKYLNRDQANNVQNYFDLKEEYKNSFVFVDIFDGDEIKNEYVILKDQKEFDKLEEYINKLYTSYKRNDKYKILEKIKEYPCALFWHYNDYGDGKPYIDSNILYFSDIEKFYNIMKSL